MNSAKKLSEQFEGVTGHYPLNKGFEANRTRKFTRKFGEIFVAKVFRGTFSVPEKCRAVLFGFPHAPLVVSGLALQEIGFVRPGDKFWG